MLTQYNVETLMLMAPLHNSTLNGTEALLVKAS